MPYKPIPARKVKVKPVIELSGVFTEYQPVVGQVYDGAYRESRCNNADFCVIQVKDKQIVMRTGEYEIVGYEDD